MAYAKEQPDFFMIKEHPTLNFIMIQVGNNMVQLDAEHQRKVFEILRNRLKES